MLSVAKIRQQHLIEADSDAQPQTARGPRPSPPGSRAPRTRGPARRTLCPAPCACTQTEVVVVGKVLVEREEGDHHLFWPSLAARMLLQNRLWICTMFGVLPAVGSLHLGQKHQQVIFLAVAPPQVWPALHHERLTRAPRRHRGEKARSTVKALFELLLVVDAALEEAVHYDVLVVQVPHLSRKDLEVLNGLCRVEGALGAKHLRHRRLERQVVLVVVSDQHQVANSTRLSSASL